MNIITRGGGVVDLVSTFFVIIEGWAEGLVSTGCQDLMVAWWSNILTPKFHHDSSTVKIRKPGFYLLSQKMGGGCAVGVGGIKSSGFYGYHCGYFVVLMILQCNYLLVITFSQCFPTIFWEISSRLINTAPYYGQFHVLSLH